MEVTVCCGTNLVSLNVGQLHAYLAVQETQSPRFKSTQCYGPQQVWKLAAPLNIPPRCSHDAYQSGQDKSLDNVATNLLKMLERIS